MGLTVDKVVHHDDVICLVIVRTWSNIAGRNPHAGDPRVVEFDPEERKTSITRRGWHKATEQQPAVSTEKLHQRARFAVALFCAWTTAIGLIDVGEDRTKTSNRCANFSI